MRLVRLNCTFNESVAAEISDFLLNPLDLNIFVASEGLYVPTRCFRILRDRTQNADLSKANISIIIVQCLCINLIT